MTLSSWKYMWTSKREQTNGNVTSKDSIFKLIPRHKTTLENRHYCHVQDESYKYFQCCQH